MDGFGTAAWWRRKAAELAVACPVLAVCAWALEHMPPAWMVIFLCAAFLASAVAVGFGLLVSVSDWLRTVIRGP